MTKTNAGIRDNHQFALIPSIHVPRSTFSRSHGVKTTLDAGFLYPIFADEVVPGDTVKIKPYVFARMNTPIFPVMDNIYVQSWFFFVPNRLIWDNFEKFMGEQDNPGDSIAFLTPQIVSPTGGFARGGLMDYLGIPPQATPGVTHSVRADWSRAYNLIYKEWFRDQNLINSPTIDKGDGPDSEANYPIRRRAKPHDYFSSCLPFPQKGAAVTLPLGTTAPVIAATPLARPGFRNLAGTASGLLQSDAAVNQPSLEISQTGVAWAADEAMYWGAQTGLVANLATATAATVNQLRTAFQLQKAIERDARSGTRYTEIVRGRFGVVSPDSRLQRPEYLGGSRIPVHIHQVASTIPYLNNDPAPMGDLAAYATATGQVGDLMQTFTEHGVILGLVQITADLNYQQGVNKMFLRRTRDDFYWSEYAHLGEQAVLSKEIYVDGTAGDDSVFGYQERYAEMRYKPSLVTGKLRTSDPLTLDSWHLALNFAARPTLNQTFIEDQPPFARVIAVPTEPHFIMDAFFQYQHTRPMPTYSVPGMIDHF